MESKLRMQRLILAEKGVSLTPEAQAWFDALPEQFIDFIAAPANFAVQWAEAA